MDARKSAYTKLVRTAAVGLLFFPLIGGCSSSVQDETTAAKTVPQQIVHMASLAVAASKPTVDDTKQAEAGMATASIHGTVTADAGQVIGFRVKAKNAKANMTWDVFTRKGQFRVPQLTPGVYEVWVAQDGYDSPRQVVEVKSGDEAEVVLKLTAKEGFDPDSQFRPRDSHTFGARRDVPLVEYDKLYPPGPGRDVLEENCFTCHGTWFHNMRNSPEGWAYIVRNMIDRRSIPNHPNKNIIYTKENFPEKDAELLRNYLAENFGPDDPYQDLLLDKLVPNEDVIADAVFIEYDVPLQDGYKKRSYHDPYIAPDGGVWANDRRNRSFVHIDPDARDAGKMIIEEYQAPWETTSMHGITIDRRSHVYYADVAGGYFGELDLNTKKWRRYETTGAPDETMVQIVVDSKDNVWGGLISTNSLAKLNAETKEVSLWHWPTPDTNPYGLIAAHDDKIWTAGISKNVIIRFDPVTETFTEFKTPTRPSAPRRLGEDKQGNIWWAEYTGGHIGVLNPKTGVMKEYQYPLAFSRGYDCWPIGKYIWSTEATYETFVRFDPGTEEFVYYPIPLSQPSGNPGVPKMETGKDGTIWFAYRGVQDGPNPLVAFRPLGNAESK